MDTPMRESTFPSEKAVSIHHRLAVLFLLLLSACSCTSDRLSPTGCTAEFKHHCQCGYVSYQEDPQKFVTNCTASKFETASMLKETDLSTEVLVFRGNNVPNLPENLLGTVGTLERLKVVDLSGNRIQRIHNDSFDDNFRMVIKLVLDDNDWIVDDNSSVFQEFESLEELHLIGAFSKNLTTSQVLKGLDRQFEEATKTNFALQHLKILHLENNLLTHFKDDSILCYLPTLLELHLGQNRITELHITHRCASNLQVLNLNGNLLKKLSSEFINQINTLPKLNIDLDNNAFSCDCLLKNTTDWIQNSQHHFLNKEKYKCEDGYPSRQKGRLLLDVQNELQCTPLPFLEDEYPRAGLIILAVVLAIAAGLVAGLVYMNRVKVRQCLRSSTQPILRKFEYSSISGRRDDEVDV